MPIAHEHRASVGYLAAMVPRRARARTHTRAVTGRQRPTQPPCAQSTLLYVLPGQRGPRRSCGAHGASHTCDSRVATPRALTPVSRQTVRSRDASCAHPTSHPHRCSHSCSGRALAGALSAIANSEIDVLAAALIDALLKPCLCAPSRRRAYMHGFFVGEALAAYREDHVATLQHARRVGNRPWLHLLK